MPYPFITVRASLVSVFVVKAGGYSAVLGWVPVMTPRAALCLSVADGLCPSALFIPFCSHSISTGSLGGPGRNKQCPGSFLGQVLALGRLAL